MLKKEIFNESLLLIKNKNIRDFVSFVLDNVPDYFWSIKASPSGLHHGNQTLTDHILGCVSLGKEVCKQQSWNERNCDILYSSLILHDCWKCGDGEETYTVDDFFRNNCERESIGKIKTKKTHPLIGYLNILKLSSQFKFSFLDKRSIKKIAYCVRYHMGPWTKDAKPFKLKRSYNSLVIQVHNIDFFQAKFSKLVKLND